MLCYVERDRETSLHLQSDTAGHAVDDSGVLLQVFLH